MHNSPLLFHILNIPALTKIGRRTYYKTNISHLTRCGVKFNQSCEHINIDLHPYKEIRNDKTAIMI